MVPVVLSVTNADFDIDDNYQRKYTDTYRVWTPHVTAAQAWGAVGIGPGMFHPSDAGARCIGGSAKLAVAKVVGDTPAARDPDRPGEPYRGYLWDVAINYGPWNPLEHWPGGDPLAAPLMIRFDPAVEEIPVFEDYEGEPLVNSAGDYFDPGLTGKVTKGILTVIRNESAPDVFAYNQYANKTNEGAWNNWPPHSVLSLPIALPEAQWAMTANFAANGKIYYPVKYQFDCNPLLWRQRVANRGYRQLVASGPADSSGVPAVQSVKILDKLGQPINEPAWLDDQGAALEEVTKDTMLFQTFDVVEPIDFGVFNLDYLTLPT